MRIRKGLIPKMFKYQHKEMLVSNPLNEPVAVNQIADTSKAVVGGNRNANGDGKTTK